jgi:hypothetical protein
MVLSHLSIDLVLRAQREEHGRSANKQGDPVRSRVSKNRVRSSPGKVREHCQNAAGIWPWPHTMIVLKCMTPPAVGRARAAAPSRGRGRLFKTAGLLLLHANSCSSTTEDRSVDGATRHARSRRPGRVAGALVPVGEAAGRAQSRGRCLKCTPQKSTVSKGTNE